MSDLRFSIEFRNRFSGAQHTVLVDLGEFTVQELEQTSTGPGKYTGPVAGAFAYQHAARRMGAQYVGLPETVRAHKAR
jgi:hypothetical protein